MGRKQQIEIEQEIECLIGQLYWYIDHRQFTDAVQIYMENAELVAMDVTMRGQDEILKALIPALGTATIRHVATNLIVTVKDQDHASCDFYTTVYYASDVAFETTRHPISLNGPLRTHDINDEWKRTEQGWKIAQRIGHTIFHANDIDSTGHEVWPNSSGKN